MTRFTANYMTKMGMYIDDTPVSRARLSHLAGNFASLDGQELKLTWDFASMMKPFRNSRLTQRSRRAPDQATPRRRTRGLPAANSILPRTLSTSEVGSEPLSWNGALRYGKLRNVAQLVRPLDVEDERYGSLACKLLVPHGRNCEMLGRNQEAIDYYKRSPSSQEAGTVSEPVC